MTASVLDRVVRWNLDLDGDIYGDERERLRWYEGIATAASVQWMAIPWAAAILVWIVGRPVVVPLTVVLVVMAVPMALCTAYVRGRRVNTVVRRWTGKRIVLSVAITLPTVLFLAGAIWAYGGADSSVWWGVVAGMAFGAGIAGAGAFARSRKRPAPPVTEDED